MNFKLVQISDAYEAQDLGKSKLKLFSSDWYQHEISYLHSIS